jgi:hypothetical protein
LWTVGCNILNIANTADGIAFVTYKKEFTPFDVARITTIAPLMYPLSSFTSLHMERLCGLPSGTEPTRGSFAEEQVASKYLALELEKVDIKMNNSTVNKRFSTYVNRQAR